MTATDFALFGDTNMQPQMHGPYSCNWLADEVPCEYIYPDHGPHGRIDAGFVSDHVDVKDLARIAGKNPDLDRLPGGGSDHGCVVGKLRRKGQRQPFDNSWDNPWYTFLFWNVERDRSKREIKQMLMYLKGVIQKYNVELLCLQEMQDYHMELAALANALGFKIFHGPGHAKGQNAILVKNKIKTSAPVTMQMSKDGWPIAGGGTHAPIYMQVVTIDNWLRLGSIHWVVGVDVVNGRLRGLPPRVEVWRQTMTKTRVWCKKIHARSSR